MILAGIKMKIYLNCQKSKPKMIENLRILILFASSLL